MLIGEILHLPHSGRGSLLRLAVGLTHVLRCRLVMGCTIYQNPWIILEHRLDSSRLHGPLSDILHSPKFIPIEIGIPS